MHWHANKERGSYRAWLHWGRNSTARIDVCWRTWLCGASIKFDDEHGWGVSLRLPPLALYASIDIPRLRLSHDREVEISAHSGAIWWHLWTPPYEWSSKTPRWRQGNFNVVDFLLGRQRYERRTIEERDVLVPMPEGTYQANAKLEEFIWSRPRWFTKRLKRVSFEIPSGIPHAGKGENSWDCGDDATFGLTTGECKSIPEGIGVLVGSCLRDRVRYGGWEDYTWKREAAS